jgi:hypothetical protein
MKKFWVVIALDDKAQLVMEPATVAMFTDYRVACTVAVKMEADTHYQMAVLEAVRITGGEEPPHVPHIDAADLSLKT